MKKLFILLVIWLCCTIMLALNNLNYQEISKLEYGRRLLLVYSYTLYGCMIGAEKANTNYNFVNMYEFCKELGFKNKDFYSKGAKK